MQFVGAEGSGMSLLVKITSELEVGGRAGGAGWGRGASGSESQLLLRSFRVKRYRNMPCVLGLGFLQ